MVFQLPHLPLSSFNFLAKSAFLSATKVHISCMLWALLFKILKSSLRLDAAPRLTAGGRSLPDRCPVKAAESFVRQYTSGDTITGTSSHSHRWLHSSTFTQDHIKCVIVPPEFHCTPSRGIIIIIYFSKCI